MSDVKIVKVASLLKSIGDLSAAHATMRSEVAAHAAAHQAKIDESRRIVGENNAVQYGGTR